jgi:gliding motility-associated-like protein
LTEACGSPAVDTCITIDNPVEIFPVLTPDTTQGCFPVTINFANTTNSTEIATTLVDFGDGQIISYPGTSSFSHIYTQPGVYTVQVEVTSIFGCLYDSTYTNMIEAFDYPEANFNILPNDVTFFDPNVLLENNSSSNVVDFQWTIPSGNPSSAVTENANVSYPSDVEGNYPVTLLVTDQNSCRDTITKIVNVISEVVLYAPNSFTPDGDEHNQTWKLVIDGIDIYSAEILIFNRWGEVIWECHDVSEGWDGTYDGQIVQNGTYTWTLKFKDIHTDKKYEFSGHIVLIR